MGFHGDITLPPQRVGAASKPAPLHDAAPTSGPLVRQPRAQARHDDTRQRRGPRALGEDMRRQPARAAGAQPRPGGHSVRPCEWRCCHPLQGSHGDRPGDDSPWPRNLRYGYNLRPSGLRRCCPLQGPHGHRSADDPPQPDCRPVRHGIRRRLHPLSCCEVTYLPAHGECSLLPAPAPELQPRFPARKGAGKTARNPKFLARRTVDSVFGRGSRSHACSCIGAHSAGVDQRARNHRN